MPPSKPSAPRGRPLGSKNTKASSAGVSKGKAAAPMSAKAKGKQRATRPQSDADNDDDHRTASTPIEIDDDEEPPAEEQEEEEESDDDEPALKTIPPALLTRILHEFFEKDGTKITKDANEAVARYMDVFVKEALARAAAERKRGGSFLEVEDLEKIAPQLLLDL